MFGYYQILKDCFQNTGAALDYVGTVRQIVATRSKQQGITSPFIAATNKFESEPIFAENNGNKPFPIQLAWVYRFRLLIMTNIDVNLSDDNIINSIMPNTELIFEKFLQNLKKHPKVISYGYETINPYIRFGTSNTYGNDKGIFDEPLAGIETKFFIKINHVKQMCA